MGVGKTGGGGGAHRIDPRMNSRGLEEVLYKQQPMKQ